MIPLFSLHVSSKTKSNKQSIFHPDPAGNYMFKVNNRNTRTRCKICFSVSIVDFEQVNDGWEEL